MQITVENIDQLNALVNIQVEEADYSGKVEQALKKLRNKASVPGFRPGMVPTGMIKKMYGKSVLSEEVSRMMVDAMYKHLDENNIEFLGQPLPNVEKTNIDWDNQTTFNFFYDLGLRPSFEVNVPAKEKFENFVIKVEDKVINEEVEALRKRYGKVEDNEVVGENDLVSGQLVELNDDNTPKEGGIDKQVYFMLERMEDKNAIKALTGAKKEDKVVINAKTAFKDAATAAIYLGIKEEELAELGDKFEYTISAIQHMAPADLDQEFFDRLFGKDQVTSEADMRTKIGEMLQMDLQGESNARLLNDIREKTLNGTAFEMPDSILKRWLVAQDEEGKNFTKDNIDALYNEQRDVFKWELIRNQIVKENNIDVPKEDIENEAKRTVFNRVRQMGYSLPEERIDELAHQLLHDGAEFNKIVAFLQEIKVLELLKSKVKVAEKEISYSEFLESMKQK